MELQCKERVDLLEALRRSRMEMGEGQPAIQGANLPPVQLESFGNQHTSGTNLEGTKLAGYPDLSRLTSARPSTLRASASEGPMRSESSMDRSLPIYLPSLPARSKPSSRSTSPERRNRMKTTLRTPKDGREGRKASSGLVAVHRKPHDASKAAGLAWDSISRSSEQRLSDVASRKSTPTVPGHRGHPSRDSPFRTLSDDTRRREDANTKDRGMDLLVE